ncbi:intramembrane serine protease GlpG [Hartmannibacter diazotrophicus]|uniref:Intramembrane serine protease GlpG n=1 Tax=Hartmannibacter diazotrophicus TaxID=1482074 RepID=A0A2C9D516_9HYPH|nr:rhomboid family intramembrane serine protease [Hartmannibacter diazotrophicus]SON55432.1 intramembrane serine protease GlpG [Hartmannibacter diazotrophicus]
MDDREDWTGKREPMLNVPFVLLALIGAMAGIHFGRTYLFNPETDSNFLILFSFIPARFQALAEGVNLPGGEAAAVWSFVTYAFLHADFIHLGVNCLWMLAFGTTLARRFGTARFLAFSGICAVAGAVAHLIAFYGQIVPVIGASAAVSGHMAGTCRFAFSPHGHGMGMRFGRKDVTHDLPALSLVETLTDRRILFFIALWFAINTLAGVGALSMPGEEGLAIAWQAHVGGFLAGLLLFSLFDPVKSPRDEPVE